MKTSIQHQMKAPDPDKMLSELEAKRNKSMNPIPVTFRSHGFDYKQVYRDGLWCIFRQTKEGTDIEKYEVIKLKVAPAHTFPNGKSYPEREVYPGSEEWGTYGWTCADLESAHRRLKNQCSLVPPNAPDASEG